MTKAFCFFDPPSVRRHFEGMGLHGALPLVFIQQFLLLFLKKLSFIDRSHYIPFSHGHVMILKSHVITNISYYEMTSLVPYWTDIKSFECECLFFSSQAFMFFSW